MNISIATIEIDRGIDRNDKCETDRNATINEKLIKNCPFPCLTTGG
jgi:hypothetical protein